MKQPFNNRILVIDDEETIRDSFREILLPRKRDVQSLEAASASLFGDEMPEPVKRSSSTFDFELEEAATGQEGLARVQKAIVENRPFAVIFVDMRMPGWDGLRTVQHIRNFDTRAEIVFVTAYSDFSIEEVVEKAGANVSYHCKPFSVEEIRQIATKAVYEWNKARNLEQLIEIIGEIRAQKWQLSPLLHNILQQVAALIGSMSAMLVKRDTSGSYQKIIGIGQLADDQCSNRYLTVIPDIINKSMQQTEQFAYFQIEKYGIMAIFETPEKMLNMERIYMVRLFLEHAAQAIANVELQESLLIKEKLSAVGQAINMVAHDLRTPLTNIVQATELMGEMQTHPEFVEEMQRVILFEAKRCMNMIYDVLDFTRNASLNKSSVNAKSLIEMVQKDTHLLLKELGITLGIDMVKPFYFPADETKMQRVLINLIRNAAEALKQHKTPQPMITVFLEPVKDGFTFQVRDNGPGIPDAMKEHLFTPFATHGKKGGTGLGLAIVKQFVEAHGGKISVETSLKGTQFTIFLPDQLTG